jgi:formate hydrogenlyase subunit 3/multisubunit Na+/H+ antiporter MnhD subunit
MGGLKKVMINLTSLISLAISGILLFQVFLEDEILMVAFEHNKILWFIASLASLMTASICSDYYILLSSKNSEVLQRKKSFT